MGSVAWTLPEHLRNELVTYASDAHVGEQYVRDRDVNFIYEILHKEGWEDKVRPLAELWVKVSRSRTCIFVNLANMLWSERGQCSTSCKTGPTTTTG